MKTSRLCQSATAAILLAFFFSVISAAAQDRPPLPAATSPSHPTPDDEFLFAVVNHERIAAGLHPLQWDDALAGAARRHAELMAREPELSHQYPGEPPLAERAAHAGARFSVVAENIAVGPTAAEIHYGWMHSPGHRKNILNPELAAVGIATIRGIRGLFAAQDFSRPVADLSLAQQEARVVLLLRKIGVQGANVGNDARRTCSMTRGYAGGAVRYVVRFDVSDLNALPGDLIEKIRVGGYRDAEVGACQASNSGAFTVFRVAILFD